MEDIRGFTLIEAIIVVALLTTGLLAYAQLAAMATTLNVAAGRLTHASLLAAQKVEELRSAPTAPTDGTDFVDRWGAPSLRSGATYVRRWTIEPLPGSAIGTMVIRVSVGAAGMPEASAARFVAARLP